VESLPWVAVPDISLTMPLLATQKTLSVPALMRRRYIEERFMMNQSILWMSIQDLKPLNNINKRERIELRKWRLR
jgi:hypothetical protein